MRSRSSSTSSTAALCDTYEHVVGTCANPWYVASDSYTNLASTMTSYTESKQMQDVVTPRFHLLRNKGHIINNPYSQEITMEWISPVVRTQNLITYSVSCSPQKNVYNGWRLSGSVNWASYFQSSYLPAPDLDALAIRDIAITNAFAKNSVNDAMIGATIGEMRETVSSLAKIFARAVKIIIALKKFNVKSLAKEITPKELAARYMEARYAIRPLVYDTLQIINALNNTERPRRWTIRDFATDSASATRAGHVSINNGYVKVFTDQTVAREINARSGVMSVIDRISTLQKWGADKWASTAYELMPLSFVLDWFFNVGKVISSWEPTIGMKHLASWVVVTDTTTYSSVVSGTECLWPTVKIQEKLFTASGSATKVYKLKYRVPNPSRPVLPRWNVQLDALKILDLGLILKGALSSKR